jgi:hypothetical protein
VRVLGDDLVRVELRLLALRRGASLRARQQAEEQPRDGPHSPHVHDGVVFNCSPSLGGGKRSLLPTEVEDARDGSNTRFRLLRQGTLERINNHEKKKECVGTFALSLARGYALALQLARKQNKTKRKKNERELSSRRRRRVRRR